MTIVVDVMEILMIIYQTNFSMFQKVDYFGNIIPVKSISWKYFKKRYLC